MSILKDVLRANLKVVFCGTAAGNASAMRQAYYAGPGNRFWRTLFEIGLTPHQLKPEDYESISQYGLGLTDLVKSVSGVDAILKQMHFDQAGLLEKINRYKPDLLAFTSKRAGEEFLKCAVLYGLQATTIGSTRLFVLPSPSGAARRFWSIYHWHELSRLVMAPQ
jgi:TDG/mug DNA glycosylase family protein